MFPTSVDINTVTIWECLCSGLPKAFNQMSWQDYKGKQHLHQIVELGRHWP